MFLSENGINGIGGLTIQQISWVKYALAFAAILVLLLILILGAYKASSNHRASRTQPLLSNGTALFAPTTILISLDGFRADFLHRGMSPALSAFIEQGVSPQYMLPSFPSVPCPNHFTLVTGLYPESHGVVGNSFYDPELDEDFYYTDSSISMQSKWWSAEPIWNTLEKQGIKSAIHMWPGSEAHIDNMDPATLAEAVGIVDGRCVTEASGRITAETAGPIARAGVDLVSAGWITHSAPVLDIGLDHR